MLKYLISTTEYLLVVFVLIAMLLAYINGRCGIVGRWIVVCGTALGFAAAIVMAYLKNKTKLIDTGRWNMRIFVAALIVLLLFIVLDLGFLRRRMGEAGKIAAAFPAAMLAFLHVFYAFPDVLAYPYTIVLNGEAVMSTGFLYRIIGIFLALIILVVMAMAVYLVCVRIRLSACGALLKAALGITALEHISKVLKMLYSARIIRWKWVFPIIKYTSNHANYFRYAVLLTVIFLPVVLWIRSFSVHEPYRNPAEHRKIRAKWRSIRRWSTALLVCALVSSVTLTVVKAYVNKPVELSQVEECEQRGDTLYIPFSQVEDGHLHRFGYMTENGVEVRFIIIKKPNSTAYGVGLDACDICGETGYYERGDQVICNRCDVVMNVNTIGFKGGCNPKVIDYSIENSYIMVPVSTLEEHEKDFK